MDNVNLPKSLIVIAKDAEGTIMSLQHSTYDIVGLQYQP
ncbi:MAG: hypothetical protein FDW93_00410 [Bergeyella sp.]|nr:hypothetical protein [Bergeyella sp.]